jgi:hypothetical protein
LDVVEEFASGEPGPGEVAVLRGTAATLGGIVGLFVGGPAGALAGAAATPVIETIVLRGRERAVRRANEALETAAVRLGLDEQAFVDRALSNDGRLLLTLQVVQAASRTHWDEKVRLLGRVLADGLGDGTRLDEAGFIAATINDIEPAHVELLAYIFERAQPRHAVMTSSIRADLPDFGETIFAILAALDRHGLIGEPPGLLGSDDAGVDVDAGWSPTGYGRKILSMLREAQ